MIGPTPLLDFFRRGEVPRDVRLLAAQGELAPRGHEQLAILMHLFEDADADIRGAADATLRRIPQESLRSFLARSDVPPGVREFFAGRGIQPAAAAGAEPEEPFIDTGTPVAEPEPVAAGRPESTSEARESLVQQLTKMSFTDRLKAAVKGTREMRALLVRDPNKMIAVAVLSSPKLTESEVESIARMASVPEDVLRIIGSNRAWTKNYGVVVGLTRNPKTPLALSMNLLSRLMDRDVNLLSIDRNVPEPLRIAARKKVVESTSRR